jgi:hypothetical protein
MDLSSIFVDFSTLSILQIFVGAASLVIFVGLVVFVGREVGRFFDDRGDLW